MSGCTRPNALASFVPTPSAALRSGSVPNSERSVFTYCVRDKSRSGEGPGSASKVKLSTGVEPAPPPPGVPLLPLAPPEPLPDIVGGVPARGLAPPVEDAPFSGSPILPVQLATPSKRHAQPTIARRAGRARTSRRGGEGRLGICLIQQGARASAITFVFESAAEGRLPA
jgi:hypothetical protein